jgi:hypothetical protein
MRTVAALLVGIVIGMVVMYVFAVGFLIPAPVDKLESYCEGAVDLFVLTQGADLFDPAVLALLPELDAGCREDVLSGEFAGRAAKG